jgi:2-polyprenyl-3-methyl-5-hydroxy-6-metoxy-1,4-benzoquinol methylase
MSSASFAPCPFCSAPTFQAVTLPAHRIIACRRCLIARTEPPPSAVDYDEQDFHGTFTYQSAADLPATWRKGLEMQKDLLRHRLPPGARILEIGCGQGFLLGLLAQAGLAVRGIEPSRSATRSARAAGLDVTEGYFTAANAPTGPFDAVVVSHVLEHVEHPAQFLADIAAVAPGALLLLVQANWRGWVPRKTKSLWHAWAEGHHYWHFTPRGLQRWLVSRGCTPVVLEYSSLEHGTYWLSRLARWFPGASDQFHLVVRLPRA